MAQHILIVDDDERLTEMLAGYLTPRGFSVERRADGRGGLAALEAGDFDAVILDVMLPDTDGFEICRRIRGRSDVPILMLTARGDATDRIVGLEIGADDYLPKPFEPRELLARLRAILRRRHRPGGAKNLLRFGALEIDLDAREARLRGATKPLTSYQFALLAALASHPGRVLSRDAIMDMLKGEPLEAFDRSIDVHISRIRSVIEDDAKNPKRVLTVRGSGYLFARKQDA